MDRSRVRRDLARWFSKNGRDLPWRRDLSPYAVLVSEFMLQQTQVASAIGYFQRWMERFPTAADLARADEREVLGLWEGLGYYSRARNLHAAAKKIVADLAGEVPEDPDALAGLPGVGEYTVAAIRAFAFDRPAAVVDGNVARVLARLHDYRMPVDTAAGKAFLRGAAGQLQSAKKGGRTHNSAIMELGALVCTPRNPRCPDCPIRRDCAARDPGSLPVKKPRVKTTALTEHAALVIRDGRLALVPSPGPRWKGLWCLPDAGTSRGRVLHVEEYPITRYRVRLEIRRVDAAGFASSAFFSAEELAGLPMPAPHRRAVAALVPHMHNGA